MALNSCGRRSTFLLRGCYPQVRTVSSVAVWLPPEKLDQSLLPRIALATIETLESVATTEEFELDA